MTRGRWLFGVRRGLAVSAPLTNHLWPAGPVLDQGAEGQCVGWPWSDAADSLELTARAEQRTIMPGMLGLAEATQLYKRAQQLDDMPGEAYTGTSVLAGMKAGQEQGLWAATCGRSAPATSPRRCCRSARWSSACRGCRA